MIFCQIISTMGASALLLLATIYAIDPDYPDIQWACRTDIECETEERAYAQGKECKIIDDVLVCN